MKTILTLMLCIPFALFAQEEEAKYLKGGVPEIEGKVIFTKEIPAPGMSQSALYNIDLVWLENRMAENENKSSVVFKDQSTGICAASAEEYLVFKSSALVLDRATISYRITLTAQEGVVKMEVQGIRYSYNNNQNGKPSRYLAEEWITDQYAINKKGTKLFPGMGKFRKKTIDLVDELGESLKKEIDANLISSMSASSSKPPVTTTPAAKTTPAVATTPAYIATPAYNTNSNNNNTAAQASQFEGYNKIDPTKIPGNIIKMVSQDWMLITAGNKDKYNTMTANWGGIGYLYNKPVAICFINPARYTYEFMENSDTYTLTFYTEAYRESLEYCGKVSGRDTDKVKNSGLTPEILPDGSVAFKQAWMIIECRKLVSQSLSPDSIHDPAEKSKRAAQPMHKMYIGEIINVYVK